MHARTHSRRAFLAALATTALAGCAGERGPAPSTTDTSASADTTTGGSDAASGGTGPPTAAASLPLPMTPSDLASRARSGGPGKDGIPAIDDPVFESRADADARLEPHDVVFGVTRNGVAKAYPQYILVWHEICNDTLDGDPVSVTYCPLTGTALGFDRGDTTFGVSGRLVNNNLIMYDRATEQWWPQVLATTVPSPWHDPYERRSLREFRVVWTTWARWRDQHPDTLVLTEDTGALRNYGNDPYGRYGADQRFGYYAPPRPPMFPSFSEDSRYEPKRVVVGARTSDGAVAFLKDSLRESRLLTGTLGDTPVLATFDVRLGVGYVYRNPNDVSFTLRGGGYRAPDGETYRAAGLPLDPLPAFDAMWFAWNGFYPDAEVHD